MLRGALPRTLQRRPSEVTIIGAAPRGSGLAAITAGVCYGSGRASTHQNLPRGGSPGEAARRNPDAAAAAAAAAADPRDMMAAIEKSVARGLHPDMASSRPPASITDTGKMWRGTHKLPMCLSLIQKEGPPVPGWCRPRGPAGQTCRTVAAAPLRPASPGDGRGCQLLFSLG